MGISFPIAILMEESSRMQFLVAEHHTKTQMPTVELLVPVALMQSVQKARPVLEEFLVRQISRQGQLVKLDFSLEQPYLFLNSGRVWSR